MLCELRGCRWQRSPASIVPMISRADAVHDAASQCAGDSIHDLAR
ncbi:hypothetical protein ACFPRL_31080 [Pseudoclavibacter helvolus]